MDKVKIGEHKMRVSPSKQNVHLLPYRCYQNEIADPEKTTVQIRDIPEDLAKNQGEKLRQILARFGKIWYFNVVGNDQSGVSRIDVAYKIPKQAQNAIDKINSEEEFARRKIKINWNVS